MQSDFDKKVFDNRLHFTKSADRVAKFGLAAIVAFAIFWICVVIGGIIVAVHFIIKFW
jgi:uncharacterized membrane-anchored protein